MIPLRRTLLRALAPIAGLALLASPAPATWSIVAVNTETGEVCVATATCLTDLDIQLAVPVIVVGQGAAAAQSFVSFVNKKRIYDGFLAGDTPAEILAFLEANDGFHQGRQYGIVDLFSPSASFTGSFAGEAKEDFTGVAGPIKYSIQGNVLTGDEVTFACETALLSTAGDLGQKVMAAMEAARALGGDGRCSCHVTQPTSCGVPPPSFDKSAHVASIQLARIGDVDGPCTSAVGCSSGTYYLDLNVIGGFSDPEPIFELQAMYDAWRAGKLGVPDHVLSTVGASADRLPADGQTQLAVELDLADVDGVALASGGATVSVSSLAGPGLTTVGAVTDNGDGTYSFAVTAGTTAGTETLRIVVDDGGGPVTLQPDLTVELDPAASFHAGFDEVAASADIDVPLVVDLGGALAGAPYVILASAAGTAPGFVLPGGALLPLNPDAFTSFTFLHPGPPLLPGSTGLLDGGGRALAAFVAPAGALTSAVGLRLDWAAATLSAPFSSSVADGFDVLP
ncbi:MAG: DUF1028 domain-containing protein [Planctomycetota bacterium]